MCFSSDRRALLLRSIHLSAGILLGKELRRSEKALPSAPCLFQLY